LIEAITFYSLTPSFSVVLFTSNNGPIVNDGYLDDSPEKLGNHSPAGPLRGGKYSLFDGGTRVPSILRAPGRATTGVSTALISQVDLLATFASLAGVELTVDERADSRAIPEALLGHTNEARQHLVTEGYAAQTLIRQRNWVYIPPHPGPRFFGDKDVESGASDEPQLYNLDTDIGQRADLASAHPEKVAELDKLLERLFKSMDQ
jgi:arylsulfatase A-like enzyme